MSGCSRLHSPGQEIAVKTNEPPAGVGYTYVFQTLALVILKQAVFAAKVLVAEGAVADDALSGVLAAVEVAAELPGAGHVDVGGKIMRWRR